ncbi:FAD-dependent oxidoreductase [Nibrella saemangeumensis]|uniref:FAD-dependent oxidoreductase n=1 Tax=Nibrella saemangeumensis TaxID=1084526 RepID=A0ABP8MLE4_9BACT
MNTADFLIVGQGVGGSVLAWTLDRLGCKVIVANAAELPSASRVAAGIVNPLTGRKLVRTWKADDLFPFLHQFYTSIEQQLGAHFFFPLDIYRPFRSIEEQNSYLAQTAESSIGKYVRERVNNEQYKPYIHNPYGGLEVTQAGWVDLIDFLAAIRQYFQDKNQFIEQAILPQELMYPAKGAIWYDWQVQQVIFCDGVQAQENALWSWLPFAPVKGQVLTARVEDYPIRNVVNQGVFILPVDNKTLKIGATYTWHDLNWQTSDDARSFLETKVKEILKIPYEVIQQQAGIRPSTNDRRPFLGLHPANPAVGIFNGLGTKGVSLAPYLAHEFARFLLYGEELAAEVNINRHLSLYYRISS